MRDTKPNRAIQAADLTEAALIVCSSDLTIQYINPATETLLERSARRLLDTSLSSLPLWGEECTKAAQLALTLERDVISRDVTLYYTSGVKLGRIHAVPEDKDVILTLSLQTGQEAPPSKDGAANAAVGFGRLLSHELKNPIAGARGAAQLLSQNAKGEDRELAQLIMTELDRATRIADHWSKVGDIVAQDFQSININELARDAILSAEAASGSDIQFSEGFDPSLPMTAGDRDLLLQAVLNLVTNAVEAVRDQSNPEIRIETRYRQPSPGDHVPDARLILEIQDNGSGVDPSLKSSLFNPFVTSKDAGEGLGLAFVSRVADLHSGMIDFDSQPGRTRFRFYLKQETING